jgi:hypothetical protein
MNIKTKPSAPLRPLFTATRAHSLRQPQASNFTQFSLTILTLTGIAPKRRPVLGGSRHAFADEEV